MKRLMAIFISALMCVTLFNSCDTLRHDHTVSDWYTTETEHWRSPVCNRDDCVLPDEVYDYGEHVDESGDNKCDVCGYVMPKHEHTILWSNDDFSHSFEYTCGCPTPPNAAEHFSGDNDFLCDTCGYEWHEIIPQNYSLCNLAGCEWLLDINAENIEAVKIISGAVGVAPGAFMDISFTSSKAVITRILEAYRNLNTTPISAAEGAIDGGGAVTVKFVLNDGTTKTIYINNGNYYDTNGYYFKLRTVPKFEVGEDYVNSYSFLTYQGVGEVYNASGVNIDTIEIDELEFRCVSDDVVSNSPQVTYYIETEFDTLYFVSDRYFHIGEIVEDYPYWGDTKPVYYELVGKTLYELIDDPTVTEYSLVYADDWTLYEPLKSSYKVGEVVSVKLNMALDVGFLFLVNGEEIATFRDVAGLYWEFTFIMPSTDVVINFKTYDGFLPDYNYEVLIEAYLLKHLNASWVSIDQYYGEYDSGAIVAIIVDGCYADVVWDEVVAGYTFCYGNSNRITVLYNSEFYTLAEAYENGYLTIEDLANIAEQNNTN